MSTYDTCSGKLLSTIQLKWLSESPTNAKSQQQPSQPQSTDVRTQWTTYCVTSERLLQAKALQQSLLNKYITRPTYEVHTVLQSLHLEILQLTLMKNQLEKQVVDQFGKQLLESPTIAALLR